MGAGSNAALLRLIRRTRPRDLPQRRTSRSHAHCHASALHCLSAIPFLLSIMKSMRQHFAWSRHLLNLMSNIATTSLSTTLIAQLEAAQAAHGITDQQLCEAVGFDRPVVLKLIKAGTMNFPLAKVPTLAKALHLDPADLMRAALHESSPELSEAVAQVFDLVRLTATEVNLINHLRKLCGGQPGSPIVLDGKGVIALVAA